MNVTRKIRTPLPKPAARTPRASSDARVPPERSETAGAGHRRRAPRAQRRVRDGRAAYGRDGHAGCSSFDEQATVGGGRGRRHGPAPVAEWARSGVSVGRPGHGASYGRKRTCPSHSRSWLHSASRIRSSIVLPIGARNRTAKTPGIGRAAATLERVFRKGRNVVRDDNSSLVRSPFQNRRVIRTREPRILDANDVDLRIASKDAAHDVAVEVLVSCKTQHGTGTPTGGALAIVREGLKKGTAAPLPLEHFRPVPRASPGRHRLRACA